MPRATRQYRWNIRPSSGSNRLRKADRLMSGAFSRSRVRLILIDPCAKRAALPIEGSINPAGPLPMAFTLAHLSDPHLPPLPAARLRDLASKRALGYLNW